MFCFLFLWSFTCLSFRFFHLFHLRLRLLFLTPWLQFNLSFLLFLFLLFALPFARFLLLKCFCRIQAVIDFVDDFCIGDGDSFEGGSILAKVFRVVLGGKIPNTLFVDMFLLVAPRCLMRLDGLSINLLIDWLSIAKIPNFCLFGFVQILDVVLEVFYFLFKALPIVVRDGEADLIMDGQFLVLGWRLLSIVMGSDARLKPKMGLLSGHAYLLLVTLGDML